MAIIAQSSKCRDKRAEVRKTQQDPCAHRKSQSDRASWKQRSIRRAENYRKRCLECPRSLWHDAPVHEKENDHEVGAVSGCRGPGTAKQAIAWDEHKV